MTDYIRLAFGTIVVLAPGWAIARALGRRGAAATLAWTLAAIAVALAVTFAVHGSLWLTLGLELAAGAVALAWKPPRVSRPRGRVTVALLGFAFGIALWFVSGPIGGDGLFHLGRVRKLDAFGDLSLRSVDEFADGGLHPGYAFPLWHGFLALVAKVSGLDPTVVVRHEPSLLAPLAFLLAYQAGVAVFARSWCGWAVLLGTVALYGLAPGHGGAYVFVTNPGTAARQLLLPAAIALFFGALTARDWRAYATLAALAASSALVHPAFTAFMLLSLGGYALARVALLRGGEWRETAAALAAFALPFGAVLVWLRPIVESTAAVLPDAAERTRALRQYGHQLVLHGSGYRLSAAVVSRGGAVAVAALLAVPAAVLAPRRRWSAFVLGGSLLVLVLMLVPWLFTHFSDAVSLSQSRRAAGFLPFAFAFAGGAWALARLGAVSLPLALGLGIAFQLAWPGDFGGRTLETGGPAVVTWIAAFGAAAALLAGLVWPLRLEESRPALVAAVAALFVLPVAVGGFADWSPAPRMGATELPAGLVTALRTKVPKRAVVFSDLETSYRIAAYAPVYVASAPPAHVANTHPNDPYGRRKRTLRFFATGDLGIPRGFGAGWIVLDRNGPLESLPLPQAYAGGRYVLYRLTR